MVNTYTEAEIVAGCARNERIFQEILYRRYFATMMQKCLRHTNGDRETALEILNDGFLRVFKKIHTFEFRGSLEGWIRQLVFHAISDYFRSNAQYLAHVVLENDDLAVLVHENVGATEGVLGALYYQDLLDLVEKLPPATRDVFKLYQLDGLNHQEIAEQMSISVGTSKWHLSSAKEKLREWIVKSTELRQPSE